MIFLLLFLFSDSLDQSEVVDYRGKKIVFIVDSSLVYIYGEAEATFGKLNIWADTLSYYLKDKFLKANGAVRFNDGSDDILAERMTYDVETKKATAYKVKTTVEKGWVYGERARYLDGKVLKIKNGYFTTCELDPPHYWFYSPYMRVNIDESVVAEPVILLVRGVPLFFIPFWFQPLKKERCSGFITPSFGSSSYGGKYIEDMGWYQTLGPHADATIAIDYYTKQGVKSHIDGRWQLFPYGDGTLTGSYIKEREKGKERWTLKLGNRSRIPGDISVNLYSDIASDNEYSADYKPGEVEKLLKDLSYGGNVSWRSFGFGIYGVMDYREDVRMETVRKKWPSLNITFPHFKWGIISLKGSSKYIRDESEHWASGIRSDANMGFNLSVFTINFGFSGMSDYYEREEIFVKHWSSRVSMKTRLYGLSLFGIGPIDRFRHVLTPSVSIGYAPEPDSYAVTTLSGFSLPRGSKSLGLSLSNLFQCKMGEKEYNFASLSLSSSYKPEEERFSSISISGNMWFGKNLSLNSSTSYDLYERKFGDKNVNIKFDYKTVFGDKPMDIDIKHRVRFTEDQRIQQTDMTLKFHITPKWRANLTTHYDFEEESVTRSSFSLTRNLHCWELSMGFNRFGSNWDYSVKLDLRKLPEIKVERSTFRTLFP